MYNSIYDSVVVIHGDELEQNANSINNFLSSRIKNFFVIGDGEKDILNKNEGEYNNLNKLINYSQFTDHNMRTLVVINTHGETDENGEHTLQFGPDTLDYYSKDLFTNLSAIFDKPIDILFAPCFGGHALSEINKLPIGSRLAILANINEPTWLANMNNLLNIHYADSTQFALDNFFEHYLFHMESKETPMFAEVGGKIIDPYNDFDKSLPFTIDEKEYVSTKLQSFCDEGDVNCSQLVTIAINNLDKELNQGLKISQQLVSVNNYNVFNNVSSYLQDISKLYLDPPSECSVELYEIKANIEQIVDFYESPYLVDLNTLSDNIDMNSDEEDLINMAQSNAKIKTYFTQMVGPIGDEDINYVETFGIELLAYKFINEYRQIAFEE